MRFVWQATQRSAGGHPAAGMGCVCHATSCRVCLPLFLQAPPGAGKTTTVPLALLLHQPEYLKQGQTIMVGCENVSREQTCMLASF